MLSISTCAPPGQAYIYGLLTNSNDHYDSYTRPRQSKSRYHFLHKSPHFCIGRKSGGCSFVIGIVVKIKKFRQAASY